MNKVQN